MRNFISILTEIFRDKALRFIVMIGIVDLFADTTYEGARSITGPFLAVLGASSFVVGFVAGFGELLGYAIQFFSGFITDRANTYWRIAIGGYIINLLAVPLLALAGSWEAAAALIITERMGRGIRLPSRDVMLSYASSQVGYGWGYGLHNALDQTGAIIGPLIVAFILFMRGTYQMSFAFLLLPAMLAIVTLVISRIVYPTPHDLEVKVPQLGRGFTRAYWLYIIAISLIAAGFADFALIAYHFQLTGLVSPVLIPIFYAVAMGVDAIAALLFGKLFDKMGISVMIIMAVISTFFAPLVFLGGFYLAFIGMILWGISMGAQESIMRSSVAVMSTVERRGSAFGVLNSVYGISWFAGSVLMGYLYGISIMGLVIFSVIIQIVSIPLFISVLRIRSTTD